MANPKNMSYTARTPEELKQDEINDLKRHIQMCDAALILTADADTAMAVKIALGGNNYFELWVADNSKIQEVITHERQLALKNIEELTVKD